MVGQLPRVKWCIYYYIATYVFSTIFFCIFHTGYIMDNHDNDILETIGGLDKNSLNNILNNKYSPSTDMAESKDLSSSLKHSSYYDTKSFTALSFNTASIRSKFDQIDIFLNELSLTCHPPISAICVQETWLSEEDDSSLFKLNGHNCISKGETCSQKGGLIIYLNENFTYKTIDIREPSTLWESQLIEISSPALSKKVIIGNFYRRPKENVDDHKQFIDKLSPILLYLESLNAEVILAGDFNINLLNIKNKDTASNFFNTITAHVFFPEITLPTRFTDRTGTLIDNFFRKVSEISPKSSPGILIDKFSDHQPYFTSFDLKLLHDSPPKFISISKHSPEALINFGNELESCDLIDKIEIGLGGNPNDNYTKLQDILIKLKKKTSSK